MKVLGRIEWVLRLSILGATALLGGCYTAPVAVIDKSEVVPVSGRYTCRLPPSSNGEHFGLTVAPREAGGYPFTSKEASGTLRFARLASGRYLIQIANADDADHIFYAYGESTATGGFRTFVPDRVNDEQSARLQDRFGVRFLDYANDPSLTGNGLSGEPRQILSFLKAASTTEVADWFSCNPASQEPLGNTMIELGADYAVGIAAVPHENAVTIRLTYGDQLVQAVTVGNATVAPGTVKKARLCAGCPVSLFVPAYDLTSTYGAVTGIVAWPDGGLWNLSILPLSRPHLRSTGMGHYEIVDTRRVDGQTRESRYRFTSGFLAPIHPMKR